MAIEASAKITLRGGPEALRALQGISRATKASSKESQAAARETERWQRMAIRSHQQRMREEERAGKASARAAQAASKAQQKAHSDAARAAEKAAKDIERIQQREADRWQRLAQQSARVREKAQQDATRAAQREAAKQIEIAKRTAASEQQARRDAIRKAGGFIGAAAAGALAGATVAAGTARGIAGVKDVRERITSANEFRERLFITTGDAGMNAQQREAVQSQVLAASTASGKDIGELLSVLETGQAQFNDLAFFADNLKEIATISKSAGADTGEFAKALGSARQAFGLTGEDAMEAAYIMKAASAKGSIEVKHFASNFAAGAGIFAQNTKQSGIAGFRQFIGAAQGIGTGQKDPAETAVRLERFITDLNDVKVQKKLRGIGIKNIVDKSGRIDVANVVDQLSSNKKFASAGRRQEIFEDVRGLQAIEFLMAANQRVKSGATGAVDMRSIGAVDAQAGRDAVASTMASMQGEGFFQFQKEAARMQAETVTNLKGYNDQVMAVTAASDRLESAFGRLSLWANSIAAAGVAGGAASMLGKLAGGGAGSAGGGALAKALPTLAGAGGAVTGAGASALAAGSVGVGAAAGGAILGAASLGLAAGGAAGTLINEASGWFSGDDKRISDRLADMLFEMVHGQREQTAQARETNRKLASVDAGLRAGASKPAPEVRRGPP